ncbi:MAG: leucyl/phenylalanyl-tRNA--protein transferase [Paludibacteraceae bacterium]|nr:leucyl/phenylalanyl-tRNA--protein transferase [Paludibacteraceae bacterium]
MVFRLDDEVVFPDPCLADDDGLLAVGGDLSPERLVLAYSLGIFPWFSFRSSQILWWCPKQRFVLFPSEVHVSHSMRSLLKNRKYRVTFNSNFNAVINACSVANNRNMEDGAWLGPEMIGAYSLLHEMGVASSVEVWNGQRLVGGFYGVVRKRCFFGESMFSLEPNASKLALIVFAQKMMDEGGLLIDCQVESEHLASMGARFIDYKTYMDLLNTD